MTSLNGYTSAEVDGREWRFDALNGRPYVVIFGNRHVADDVTAIIESLQGHLETADLDIVHPHCVQTYGGETFDRNAWVDNGQTYMQHLRGRERVRLNSVGGTMSGYWDTGRLSRQTAPRRIVTIAMTLARIGRSMKNFDMRLNREVRGEE